MCREIYLKLVHIHRMQVKQFVAVLFSDPNGDGSEDKN